jgi:hypothetical protein
VPVARRERHGLRGVARSTDPAHARGVLARCSVDPVLSGSRNERETWRAVIAVLREKGLPYMLEHADYLERYLEEHGPDEAMVRLSLTDDVFLRSSN